MAPRRNTPAPLAKLTAPTPLPSTLIRPHLLQRMAAAPAGLWVASPAASGKTVLAATALRALQRPACWLQLDSGDADPGSFFHFLAQAAASWPARRGTPPLPVYSREVVTGLDDFARAWFRALAARLPQGFVLVLDDWHRMAETSPLQSALALALDELPQGAAIWVLSRHAPPPPFDAARVRGRLATLDFSDLALSGEEVRSLLALHSSAAKRNLDEQAAHWHQWCEGWVGALTFALATDRREPSSLPQVVPSGTASTVFGFLSAELFERLPSELQAFMLTSAWLPQVSARLMRQALPQVDVARAITELSRRSLLLSVDTGREPLWRYHRLLREFLRQRSLEVWGQEQLGAHLRALARKVQEEGLPEAAASLFMATGDFPGLEGLVQKEGPRLLREGRFLTLMAWVKALPEHDRKPWVCYWHASALLAQDVRASAREFEHAYQGFTAEENTEGLYRSWCGAVEANTFACDDFRVLETWLHRLRELRRRRGPAPTFVLRAQVWVYGFSAVFFSDPQTPEFAAWLRNVKRLYRLAPRRNDRLAVGGLLGLYHASMTGMGSLRAHMLALRPLLDDERLSPFHRLVAMLPDAIQHWIGGQTEDALQCLQRYAALAHETGAHAMDHQIAFQSAYVHGVCGDLAALDQQLQSLEPRLPALGRIDGAQYDFLAGWRAALAGRLPEALHLLERSVDNAQRHRFAFFEAIGRGLLAELRAMAGDFEAARLQAEQALAVGRRLNSVTALVACHMQRAIVAELGAEDESRLRSLLQVAMGYARQHGHWAWGGLMPANLSRLAMRALSLDVEPAYVRELIVRRRLSPRCSPVAHSAWPWPVRVQALGVLTLSTSAPHTEGASSANAQRPMDLLRALVCMAPAPLPVQTAIDWLWPESQSSDDRKLFDVTLHRLRKLMGDEQTLRLEGGKLALEADRVWTDLGALSALMEHAEGTATTRAKTLCALARGCFLAGDDAPWVRLARARWRRRVAQAAQQIAQELGDAEAALTLMEVLFDADPASEPLMHRLADLMIQRHDQRRAQEVVNQCNATRLLEMDGPTESAFSNVRRIAQGRR